MSNFVHQILLKGTIYIQYLLAYLQTHPAYCSQILEGFKAISNPICFYAYYSMSLGKPQEKWDLIFTD